MLKKAFFALAATSNLAQNIPTSLQAASEANSAVITCENGEACWNMVFMAWLMAQQQPKGRSGAKTSKPNQTSLRDFRNEFIIPVVANETATELTNIQQGRFGAKIPIQLVANYGCWCYGGSSWPTNLGRSTPRDLHDEACKAHSMGMKCIVTDASYEKKQCEPYTTDYDVTITQDGYGKLLLECSDSIEEDWCRRRVCLVELRLLARYWKLMDNGIWPEYRKWAHPNIGGSFDPMEHCSPSVSSGGDPQELRCCGDYPYRSWWYQRVENSEEDANQCCVYQDEKVNEEYGFAINIGQIYDQSKAECTSGGVV